MFFYGYVIYICSHMDLYMSFYGCHAQPADITERRSTHVRIRIRGRARTSIAQYARFLNSGTTAALTIPIYYKYID